MQTYTLGTREWHWGKWQAGRSPGYTISLPQRKYYKAGTNRKKWCTVVNIFNQSSSSDSTLHKSTELRTVHDGHTQMQLKTVLSLLCHHPCLTIASPRIQKEHTVAVSVQPDLLQASSELDTDLKHARDKCMQAHSDCDHSHDRVPWCNKEWAGQGSPQPASQPDVEEEHISHGCALAGSQMTSSP